MFIFSNLATSLDGKIATADRSHFYLGTPADRLQMQVLRKRADAILMGASTLRTFKGPLLIRGAERHPINVVLSGTLEGISPRWAFFRRAGVRRILFVGAGVSEAKLKPFQKSCEVVRLKKATRARPIAIQVTDALERLGVKRLLVEGGGGVMWEFAQANLIDEYHVTLTPRVLGGVRAPTLVDGPGFSPKDVLNLRLVRCKRLGDELYLTYRKTETRG